MSKATRVSLYSLNPFFYIQTRKLFIWIIVIGYILGIQLFIVDWLTPVVIFKNRQDFVFANPIHEKLFISVLYIIYLAALNRQAEIRKINTQQLIGKLPNNYQWLPIILLASFKIAFLKGSYRVLNYPLSYIAPQWVETNLAQSIFSDALESSIPFLYFVLDIANSYILANFLAILVVQGIILHRWGIKWGGTKAVLGIGLLFAIGNYTNFLNGFITEIILCLLYIKSRTLIVPIVFEIIVSSINLILNAYYFFVVQSNSNDILQQFQSEFKLGIVLFSISTPYIIWWLHKNWLNKNEELPYFANEQCFADKS